MGAWSCVGAWARVGAGGCVCLGAGAGLRAGVGASTLACALAVECWCLGVHALVCCEVASARGRVRASVPPPPDCLFSYAFVCSGLIFFVFFCFSLYFSFCCGRACMQTRVFNAGGTGDSGGERTCSWSRGGHSGGARCLLACTDS
eukprot:4358396-Pleurochrysis_carterae.AAC.1